MKGKKCDSLQQSDFPEYRSVAGSLQWASGQTRPDVAATVSLHGKGSKATYADLMAVYDAVDHLRQTSDKGFVMSPAAIDDSTIAVNADSFFGQMLKTMLRNTDVSSCSRMLGQQMWRHMHA